MSEIEVDDIAAKALGAMILEATAVAIENDGADAERALTELCADSGLVLEACAAILYATSFLAGVGGIPPVDVYAAALAWQPEEDELTAGDRAALESDGVPVEQLSDAQLMVELEHLADDDGPASSSSSTPATFTIEALPENQQGADCVRCDCQAIGLVAGIPVCFFHVDHGPDEGRCPMCGAEYAILRAESEEE